MAWSFDIASAPRGRTIRVDRAIMRSDGKYIEEREGFVPDVVWLASKCGKVIRSYWIPETERASGRWSGLATKEEPIAWHPYFIPEHPGAAPDPQQPVNLPIIEDVGGGA